MEADIAVRLNNFDDFENVSGILLLNSAGYTSVITPDLLAELWYTFVS